MSIGSLSDGLKAAVLGIVIFAWVPFLLPRSADAFCFEEAGKKYGINPGLLQSIAKVESGLNAKAVNVNKNGSTDLGVMQVNSAWIEKLKLNRKELLSDPCYNVMTGAGILKGCIDKWGYTWQAVGCYNATSNDKKIGYSWKIYRVLKKEGLRKRKAANQGEPSPGSNNKDQSLHFKVRSIEGHGVSEEP